MCEGKLETVNAPSQPKRRTAADPSDTKRQILVRSTGDAGSSSCPGLQHVGGHLGFVFPACWGTIPRESPHCKSQSRPPYVTAKHWLPHPLRIRFLARHVRISMCLNEIFGDHEWDMWYILFDRRCARVLFTVWMILCKQPKFLQGGAEYWNSICMLF